MKLNEIILNPPRDEYHDQYLHYFTNALNIATVRGNILRKAVDEFNDIHYGLFHGHNNDFIAYMELEKKHNFYQVKMISTLNDYRGQGWITYMFDYAVLNDKLTIASDTHQTPQAKEVWKSLARNGRYKIFILNTKTREKTPFEPNDDAPWDSKRETILITEQYSYTKEEIEEIKNEDIRRKQARNVVLYGPGTSDYMFWNP